MYSVGVDLGGTNIAVGLVNEEYELVSRVVVPTHASRGPNLVISSIGDAIDQLLDKADVDIDDCSSIGVGAPGTCDIENGVVIISYSLSWDHVPLADTLIKRFGKPCRIDNDANCAALAEVKAGAAKGYRNVVLITLGTGIGSGIVLNGSIYSGLRGSGAEIGHTLIDCNGELCSCGRKGCWDAYASVTSLIVQAKRAAFDRPESKLNDLLEITGEGIFDMAGKGDAAAKAVIRQYTHYLALGISNIVNALGPEVILVGGGISRQGDRLLDPVRQYVRENSFDKRKEAMPLITVASMGNDAGIVGAAAL